MVIGIQLRGPLAGGARNLRLEDPRLDGARNAARDPVLHDVDANDRASLREDRST